MPGDTYFHERHTLVTAVITATWAIVVLVLACGALSVALVLAGDDHERPVPTPRNDIEMEVPS